jgi:hypothetical protein
VDLELENLALRHQIGMLQRSMKKRPKLTKTARTLGWARERQGQNSLRNLGSRGFP